jgi:hypothetical protein
LKPQAIFDKGWPIRGFVAGDHPKLATLLVMGKRQIDWV